MDFPKHVAHEIITGSAALFLGAGASVGSGLPSGSELTTELRKRFAIEEESLNLRDLSQFIQDTHGRPLLITAVREIFFSRAASPAQSLLDLLTLPWVTVVTTNVDDLVETALKSAHRKYSLVVSDEDVASISPGAVPVFKIHGSLERATGLVLTDEDYVDFQRNRQLISAELRSLFARYTTIFVGYSFLDSDLREITQYLVRLLPHDKRKAYLVVPQVGLPMRSRLERLNISAIAGTLDELAGFLTGKKFAPPDALKRQIDKYVAAVSREFEKNENIFTMLRLERKREGSADHGEFATLNLDRLVRNRSLGTARHVQLHELLQRRGRWLVLGQPGGGKSTLLRMLTLSCAKKLSSGDTSREYPLPILVELGRYRPGRLTDMSLVCDALSSFLFERIGPDEARMVVEGRQIIWLLDSLDETMIGRQTDKLTAWEEIANLTRTFPEHTYIVSCRITHRPPAREFNELYVNDFDEGQIREFVERYLKFFSSSVDASAVLDAMPGPVRELAGNVLILSMVVSTYLSVGHIPQTLDELYRAFARHILEEIEAERPGVVSPSVKDLALSTLAFEMLVSGHASIPTARAREIIASRMHRLHEQMEVTAELGADLVLDELVYSGLLVNSGRMTSFLHLSLLEYFASCEMNREYNFVAQSEMDQHFLRNPSKIKQMIDAAQIKQTDRVLELGAGIGTVARHIPSCKKLILLELDKDLSRILRYQFPEAEILQADAVKTLPLLEFDIVLSDLPFFLTKEILSILKDKTFRCAVMSVRGDEDLSEFSQSFEIALVEILERVDFFPRQPFESKVVILRPRQTHGSPNTAGTGSAQEKVG